MTTNQRILTDRWAYDIHTNPLSIGEIYDVDVINQSIGNILGTSYGERIFNPSFGSGLLNRVFNIMSPDAAESLLDDIVVSLKQWEDRIRVDERGMRLVASPDDNSVVLIIPYTILHGNIKSVFAKKIING